jgi:hypothetical protein
VFTWLNSVRFVAFPITIETRLCSSSAGAGAAMIERRIDYVTRERVSDMSPEEMEHALMVSEKAGLPNRRALDERESSRWVTMCDINGPRALNDGVG